MAGMVPDLQAGLSGIPDKPVLDLGLFCFILLKLLLHSAPVHRITALLPLHGNR